MRSGGSHNGWPVSAVFVLGVVAAVWLLLSVNDSSRYVGEVPPVGAPIVYPSWDPVLIAWARTQMTPVETATPVPTLTPTPTMAPYEPPTPSPFTATIGQGEQEEAP